MCVVLILGCGSTKETTIDGWGLHYHRNFDIHDRVYVSDMVGFVIEVTYHPDSHLPYVRAGFASGGHIVDTTGNSMPHVIKVKRHFEVPWLFSSDVETISTPILLNDIPMSTNAVDEEITFDPDAEAIP